MVLLVIGYTYYLLKHDRSTNQLKKDETISKLREAGIVLACLLVVIISGKFTVDSAVAVAKGFVVSEWLIGADFVVEISRYGAVIGIMFPRRICGAAFGWREEGGQRQPPPDGYAALLSDGERNAEEDSADRRNFQASKKNRSKMRIKIYPKEGIHYNMSQLGSII